MLNNILTMTDSYKVTHWRQYPPNTTHIFSFFESRGGKYEELAFFGLQYFIKRYLVGRVVTEKKIQDAKKFWEAHLFPGAFNEEGWRHILKEHKGHLPITIRSVPEGTIVPYKNVMMTMVNTDPKVPWLTNWLETLLSQVWYTTTVATRSREMKKTLVKYLEKNGTPEDIAFKLHDFAYRGVSSPETAAVGGAAHLVNFTGTDNAAGLEMLTEYYDSGMVGFSVPATEHSTMTSWGRENECEAYANTLAAYPSGIVSVVSDSYDIFNVCRNFFGKELRKQILERDGVLVVRPDSGDPVTVLLKVLGILYEAFEGSVNTKGYKVLNPKVRVLQGDGINDESLKDILEAMNQNGWSADNIAFGSGGGLLQTVNRDTQKCAIKCSAACVNGEWREVMKDPITDPGKKSKAGILSLIRTDTGMATVKAPNGHKHDLLQTTYSNGKLLRSISFEEIRQNAKLV